MACSGKVRHRPRSLTAVHSFNTRLAREGTKKPSMVLTKAIRDTGLAPGVFLQSVESIYQLLSDAALSAGNVGIGKIVQSTCPPPTVSPHPCSPCVKRTAPCINLTGSSVCVSCFVKKRSPCDREDDGGSQSQIADISRLTGLGYNME